MNTKAVLILGGIAVATVAVAAFVSTRDSAPSGETAAATRGVLFEGLSERLPKVASITIKHADREFTLHRDGQTWKVAEKGGYPAKPEEIRKVLVGLAELRAGEPMTSKPERYAQIGVQDPDGQPAEPGSQAPTLVTFKDEQGGVVASAIVGNQKWAGSKRSVYIRKAGEAQSWLAAGELDVPNDPIRYIDTTIAQIPRDRVKSVTVSHPEGESLMVSRASRDQQNFTVHDIPPGKELKSATEPDALASALAYLTLEDVAPASEVNFSADGGATPGPYLEFRTFDGLVIAVEMAERDGKTWAKFTANAETTSTASSTSSGEAKEGGEAGAGDQPTSESQNDGQSRPGEKSAEDIRKEVDEFNARVANWAYAIPSWKATVLNKKMSDMLKSDQPPPPPPAMEGTTPLIPPPAPTGSTESTESSGGGAPEPPSEPAPEPAPNGG